MGNSGPVLIIPLSNQAEEEGNAAALEEAEDELARLPPTTTPLVLLNFAIVLSESDKCCFTSAGGVTASHCARLTSSNLSVLKISRKRSVVFPVFST